MRSLDEGKDDASTATHTVSYAELEEAMDRLHRYRVSFLDVGCATLSLYQGSQTTIP